MTTMTATPTRREVLTSLRQAGHPLRVAFLVAMCDGENWSPKRLAAEHDIGLGVASYHVRDLAGESLIRLVKTTQVRGAIAHHYRITEKGRAAVAPLLALEAGE